jgi:hypothetical protein
MRNVLQDDFRTTLLKVDMKKILEFDAYIQELCYDLFWNSNIDFNDFPESLLFDIPESIIFGSRTATTKCLVCLNAFGPVEFRSWDTLNITDAFGLSFQKYFVAQTDWWARHAQHESLFESIRTDSAGCANKDGYNALLNNFEQLATQFIRKYHGIDAVPPEIQICPLFLPDEMGVYPWTRDGKLEKDCLGRTWLHQYLDSKKNTCFPWKIEEVMIKSNFQRSTCFDIDKQDIIGRTPLHIACEKGLLSFAAKLIELGADVTKQTILTMTPLHLAAASGSREIVEILLRCPRVIINAQDINGWTPFHYATRHNHASICHDIADRRMPNIICKSIVCESIDRIPMF